MKFTPWIVNSVASWFKQGRLWECFLEWCRGGHKEARRAALQYLTHRVRRVKSYAPEIQVLEDRVVPDASSTCVTILNPGPEFSHVGDSVELQLEATSIGGDPLIFSAAGLPDGLSINRSNGLISGTVLVGAADNGPFRVSVTAVDPYPRTANFMSTVEFTWTIAPSGNASVESEPNIQSMAGQPIAFELNVGQSDEQVKFLSRGLGYNLFLTENRAVLTLARSHELDGEGRVPQESPGTQDVIDISFVGANANTRVVPSGELTQRTNYFQGSQVFTNVPNYSRVRVEQLYEGVNVEYYGNQQGVLEYDVIVAPGAELSQVRMQYQGVEEMRTNDQGDLVLKTAGGEVTQHAPILFQNGADGSRQYVSGRFVLLDQDMIGFEAGEYDRNRPLIVDPTLVYGTYLGGSMEDAGFAITADQDGNAYITGTTWGSGFPTLNPFDSTYNGGTDAFVTKFDPTGELIYSTFIGGTGISGPEQGNGIAVDLGGNVYVTGQTKSSDFPTTVGAYDTTMNGSSSGFVSKLNTTGDALVYSTFLDYSTPHAIAVNSAGAAFIAGEALEDFSTTSGAYQESFGGGSFMSPTDAFLVKLNAAGSARSFATFLGGATGEIAYGVAIDGDGNAYLAGTVLMGITVDFPTTSGAYQEVIEGSDDAFVTKVNAAGDDLVYSTFVGGDGNDVAYAITVDAAGQAYITGYASDPLLGDDFPTTGGAYQTSNSGTGDAFITKLNSSGSSLVFSTFAGGGSGADDGRGVALASGGEVVITGQSGVGGDATVTRMNSNGTSQVYNTTLATGTGYGIASDALGNLYLTGKTTGSLTTTPGAFQTSYGGVSDAYAVKIGLGLARPVIELVDDDTGASGTDGITNDTALTIEGVAPASSTVKLYVGGNYLASDSADVGGEWSFGDTFVEGTYSLTAQATSGGQTSNFSRPFVFTVDTTYPDITLVVPATSYKLSPRVQVYASDLIGIPEGATVSIDVDLDEDDDFEGGELGFSTGTLVNGYVSIRMTPLLQGDMDMRARVTDLAGNEGMSAIETTTVTPVLDPWTLSDSGNNGVIVSERSEGNPLLQLGSLQISHGLDLDRSPGSGQSGGSALVYSSNLTHVRPIVQATIQLDSEVTLPGTITATLTWDGDEQDPVEFNTSEVELGDIVTLGVQVETPVTETGRYAWSLTISADGFDDIILDDSTFVRVEDDSPFGAGWTFAPLNRLLDIPDETTGFAGQLMLYGDGSTRFFAGTTGTLIGPAEDNGTLVRNTDQFTITAASETSTTVTITTSMTHNFVTGQQVAITGISPSGYCGIVTVTGVTSTTFTYEAAPSLGSASLSSAKANGFPVAKTISAASETGNTVTITTSAAHGYSVGDEVTIAGITPAGYCGNFTILSTPSSTTFTYFAPAGLGSASLSAATVTGCAYWYTTPENVRLHFDINGFQTDWVSGDGFERIKYTYSSERVATMTAIDGASTTFTYANGSGTLVSEIASAGSRSWTLTHTSTNLTEIEDPDERTRVFGYDGDHHLTDETRGILVNHWDYDAESELIVQMRWGNESSPSTTDIDSVASRGLEDLYIGLPDAETTDALGYVTNYRLDAKGRQLKVTDANGAISTWTRNAGTGRVESYIDPIGRQTSYTRDADGYVTVQTNPDLTTRTWDFFANAFHSLQYFTDENTHETEYEVDSATGHVVTIIDALNKETVNAYDPETGLLETITDPMTRVVTLGYDGYRRLETREDVLGITTYGFDTTTGEVNSVEDANELETTMEFDDMGRMLSRTTPDLFQEFWVHNTAGLLETHTNKEEVDDKIVYDYFARGLVYATIDAFGTDLERSRITSFDDVGRNIGWRDALGYWSSITLDSVGRTVATFDAMGNETLSRYDLASQVIQSRDANGIWVYNTYNDRGWIEESIDSRGELWVTGFDDVGNVTSRTDPNSKETVTAYDALNRVVSVTDPELNISQTSYWDDGRVKDQTDARGKITRTEYNLEAKEIYITHALGTGKERTYTQTIDAVGNVLTTEDPNTHVQTNILDEMYRVRKVEDNAGRGDEYSFTAEGVVSQIEDESNELTLFTIDKLGRTIKTEDASGIETERFYNAADAVTAVLDDEDNYARSVFDKNGRLIASIDGRGYATHYVYNAGGLMIAYIDALSNTTRWEYDKAGNKTKEIDPLGNFRTWEYDDAGQLEKYTDKRGWTKEYTYFDNGLVETETWKDDLAATVNEVEYTYNENGQIDTVTDDAGTYDWDYDDLGRVEMVTDIWGIETTFDYDLADRLEVVADSLGGEMTYGYDSADRVETKDFDDGTTQLGMVFHYNNRNELEELERFDDNPTLIGKTLFTYFDNGQVESITHKDGSNVLINDFNYTYGDAGNVATETSDLGPSKTYGYDEDDQILTDGTNTYEWDALGNDTGHTIDPGNQLQTDGTWNYTYDEEGNTTEKVNIGNDEIWSYGYDSSNRLVLAEHKPNSVSDVDIRIVFGYDVLNNRILESVDADGDGVDPEVITKFAYDTNGNAFADLEDNLDLRTRRIYNDAVDALAARIDADTGDPNWYLTDMLGSVRDMVDKAGDPLNHRDWDAFGVQIADSGTGFDRYGYTSREYQAEMELQYNRARWYDPTTQRWLSMDPLGFDAGDSNLYRYVNNQPTISTDPSGLQPGNTPTLKDVRNLKKLVIADFQKILDGYTSATKAGASPISDESKAGLLLFLARMTNLGVAKLGKQFPSEVKKAGALIDQLPQILVPASAEREYIPYLAVSDAAPAGILDSIVRIALDVSTVAHTAVTIQSLGAADFKTRTNAEKALKDLAVTDYSVVVPVLLATKTGDAETKNRISGIVANANSRLSQALHGSELRPLLMKLQLNRLWALYTDSEKALIIGEIGDAKGVYPELVRSALNKKE